MGLQHVFVTYSKNTHFFEKCIRIKIEEHKIFVLMSILSPKLDEVNANYPCKYNSILWDFHVFRCISLIYHIIMYFFEKYVRIKIEEHKILILTGILSSKLDEVNASYTCKYNSIPWDFHVLYCISSIYHIIMYFFEKYVRIKIEDHKILIFMNVFSRK